MITLPIFSRHNLITTYVRLYHGRKRTGAHMAFDTGATSTVITPFLVRQLGLTPSTASYSIASATGVRTVRGYRLGCIQLAEEKLESIEVASLPLPARLQLDRLLGLDFLSHFIVTLDFGAMQVRLERIQTA